MSGITCPFVVVMASVLASFAAEEPSIADLKALEGVWEVVSVEAVGMKLEPSKIGMEKVVVKDGKFTLLPQAKEGGTFKDIKLQIDATKKPKNLDLLIGEKQFLPCIYEVTADEWKLAMPLIPKDPKPGQKLLRPDSFDSKDKPIVVLVTKRSKG